MRSVSNRSSVSLCALLLSVSCFCVHPPALAKTKNVEDLPISGQTQTRLDFPLRLTLCWYDAYELLPRSLETTFEEVIGIFEEVGVEIQWEMAVDADKDKNAIDNPLKYFVILLPSSSSSWGLEDHVMGVATHREGMKGSVYLFFPQIAGTLRFDGEDSPRAVKLLARAVGRVIAHEMVHILAPHHPHTDGGLMNRNLTRCFLTRGVARLDPVSAVVVRTEVRALGNRLLLASRDFAGSWGQVFGKEALAYPSVVRKPQPR
jgi:hypothetical protein